MKLKIQAIHFSADQKLLSFIQEKVDKLLHFYENIVGGEVYLKIDKSNDLENKIAEIRIQTPGKVLFAQVFPRSDTRTVRREMGRRILLSVPRFDVRPRG